MADLGVTARRSSLRSAGVRNIAISAAAAISTYVSLTLVAQRFGGSPGSDAYFFLLSLTTISTGMVGSIFATVFLPIFVNVKVREGEREAGEFAGTLLVWLLVCTVPIGVFSHLFYPSFFAFVSRFGDAQIALQRPVLGYFSAIFVISVVAEYFRVIALALGQYSSAAAGVLFQPLLLILALTSFMIPLGEEAMSIALLASKVLLLAAMMLVVLGRQAFRVPLRFRRNAAIGQFVRISAPYWSANMVTSLTTFFFDYLATGLGAGMLTSISYAQRIFTLPVAVVLTPILEIARTQFAEAQARHDKVGLVRRHNQLLHLVLYFSFPVSTLLFFLPREIVASIFQRGAFGGDHVQIAANCLRVFALSIPFTSMFMLNGRAVESFQRLAWPSALGTLGNLLMMGLTALLVHTQGYIGIPSARLATEITFFFPFGFIALKRFSGGVDTTGIVRTAAVAAISALLPAAAFFGAGLDERLANLLSSSMPVMGAVVAAYFGLYAMMVAALDRHVLGGLRTALRR